MTSKSDRVKFYTKGIIHHHLVPQFKKDQYKKKCYELLKDPAISQYVFKRANYYNQLKQPFKLELNEKNIKKNALACATIKNLHKIKMGSYYRYDFRYYLDYFIKQNKIRFQMGDKTLTKTIPTISKSRIIIKQKNYNNILMKLDALRHFQFIVDHNPYQNKKNKIVWRGQLNNPRRHTLLKKVPPTSTMRRRNHISK